MTAYGRGALSFSNGHLVVEIQSVNRRHLEIGVNLPRCFSCLETHVRKQIAHSIHRGMISVKVQRTGEGYAPVSVTPNLSLAKGIKGAWERLALDLGREEPIDLTFLMGQEGVLVYEDELLDLEEVQTVLTQVVASALEQLIIMKETEGEALANDLLTRLEILERIASSLELLAPTVAERYQTRLAKRLEALGCELPDHGERLMREVAIYADRIDFAEEVTRFKSHLKQFKDLVQTQDLETRGKTIEFLLQELTREMNTMGSKGADIEISKLSIEGKSELERIREQVQNIE